MSSVKLNVLHLHFSDMCRFGVESLVFPNLTGSLTGDYGGFYTQDDVKQIIAYAGARGIRVVPEVGGRPVCACKQDCVWLSLAATLAARLQAGLCLVATARLLPACKQDCVWLPLPACKQDCVWLLLPACKQDCVWLRLPAYKQDCVWLHLPACK
jgi:hypothetical protein